MFSNASFSNFVRMFPVTLAAAGLAACSQSSVTKKSELRAAGIASYGLASFYSDEQQTANGEKFNPNALTAAHPTLPFGTQVRVTNVATGRSVMVRINDRGPFVPGRIVDVSYSAAETLGIVGRGVAKVKLDVIQYGNTRGKTDVAQNGPVLPK